MRSYVYFTREEHEQLSVRFLSTGGIVVKDKYGVHEYGWWRKMGRYGYEHGRFGGRKTSFHNYMEDAAFCVAQDFLCHRRYGNRTHSVSYPSDEC